MTQTRAELLFGTAFLLLQIATYKVYQPISPPLGLAKLHEPLSTAPSLSIRNPIMLLARSYLTRAQPSKLNQAPSAP